MGNRIEEQTNARNPTQRLTVREALKRDITELLEKATKNATDKKYRPAILFKDQADTLFTWGIRRGLLNEDDCIVIYGDRHLKGGKEEYTPGIFPEDLEAKCRKIIDYDDVEVEVIRRSGNILDRALAVIRSREDRMAVKRVFDDISRV